MLVSVFSVQAAESVNIIGEVATSNKQIDFYTTDGGTNWHTAVSGTSKDLYGVELNQDLSGYRRIKKPLSKGTQQLPSVNRTWLRC